MTAVVGVWPGARTGLPAWLDRWRDRWARTPPRTSTAVRLAMFVAAVVAAYNYSLWTLVQTAGLETPLAYASLVPVIAVGLAVVRRRPMRPEPAIHDRQVDYIVGIPLIALAMVINLWLPSRLSAMFWVWRLDLLSMPFFVAGAVAIIFGTRVLWRQKLAVAYLLLAWPMPYTLVLLRVLDGFTNLTLAGVHGALHVFHVATPVAASDGSIFSVVHDGRAFPISVVSACSGVNGIVGFLLIGVAFGAVVTGPRFRKAIWLVGGMAFLWFVNLGRLLLIFWAGRQWGEHFSIDILHPFVGLVTFSVGVIVMVLALGPMGLQIGQAAPGVTAAASDRALRPARRPVAAVPKVAAAAVVVVVAALVLGASDVGLRSYNLVADASGEPKLTAYRTLPVGPDGWRAHVEAVYNWAKPLFGADSTWYRYEFLPTTGGNLHAGYGVTLDAIDSGDLESFSAYGVEACYQFHGYSLRDVSQVKLDGGITGQTLSYSAGGRQSWSIVYWIVPVKAGQGIRYERMVLYLLNAPGGSGVKLPKGTNIVNLAGSLGDSPGDQELAANRTFLVAFADELLAAQASPSPAIIEASEANPPIEVTPPAAVGDAPAAVTGRPRDTAVVSLSLSS